MRRYIRQQTTLKRKEGKEYDESYDPKGRKEIKGRGLSNVTGEKKMARTSRSDSFAPTTSGGRREKGDENTSGTRVTGDRRKTEAGILGYFWGGKKGHQRLDNT